MNETRYIRRPASREDWLAERRHYIGGSDVAAILGVSPWRTAVDLWLDKTGRAPKEDNPSEALRLGTYLEEYAARRYSETSGRTVRNYGFMVTRGHAVADVDRLIVPDGASIASHGPDVRTSEILECKTTSQAWPDGIPIHYECQAQLYAELLDCEHVDFAVVHLAPRREFRVYRMARDRSVGAALLERIERFWHCVEADTPPEATTLADVRALFPRGGNPPIEATAEIAAAISSLAEAEAEAKRAEERADALRLEILRYMGDADALNIAGKCACTYRAPKPRRVTDWRAVAEALDAPEDIIAAHTEEKPSARRFLLKFAPEEG